MTIEEAIYCMKSYLPDGAEKCLSCPYYGSKEVDSQVSVCNSSEAHRLAIEALTRMLKSQK